MRKKILKRVVCCLCAAAMVLGGLPTGRQERRLREVRAAQESGTKEYVEKNSTYIYEIEESGEISIIGYRGTDTEISIPEEIDGRKVTSLDFYDSSKNNNTIQVIQLIKIPKSIKNISCNCNAHNLYSQVLQLFYNFTNLAYIDVSEENEYYKDIDGVLFNKEGTELLSYPSARKEKEYIVPEGVELVLMGVCKELNTIQIPESVIKFNYDCEEDIPLCVNIYNCMTEEFHKTKEYTSITEIKVSEKNKTYKDIDGVLFNKEGTELLCYPPKRSQREYVIPEGVESIKNPFYGSKVGIIKIPSSFIGSIPIVNGITTDVKVSEENKCYKDIDGILFNKDGTQLITYPCARKEKEYTIPEGVTEIGDRAFEGCSSLESILIPKGVTKIGERAFYGCSNLKSISIPEGVTKIGDGAIGDSAFEGCSSLESILIPEGVTKIGCNAFTDCSSLKSISIPEGVTEINIGAFTGCKSLKVIELPKSLIRINPYGYDMRLNEFGNMYGGFATGCSSLIDIKVKDGNENFYDIDGVLFYKKNSPGSDDHKGWRGNGITLVKYPEGKTDKEYIVPDGVNVISGNAFSNLLDLTQIKLPDSVQQIGNGFTNCISLKTIEIPKYARFYPIIDDFYAHRFYDSGLEYIKISEEHAEYKDIDGVVFNKDGTELIVYPCSKKGDYTIPEGVTSIMYDAFRNSNDLTSIKLPEGITEIHAGFGNACISAQIPKSVTYISEKSVGYKIDNFTIYGYKNTAAQTYAAENGFKFVDLDEIGTKTSDTDINIEYKKDLIEDDDNVTLVTDELDKNDEEFGKIDIGSLIADNAIKPGDIKFIAYTIELQDKNGKTIQPKGTITVRIPVPSGYTGSKCRIYYVDVNGVLVDMKAVFKNAFMEFTTNHFSTYMITETELKTGVAPPTEDSGSEIETSEYKSDNEDKTQALSQSTTPNVDSNSASAGSNSAGSSEGNNTGLSSNADGTNNVIDKSNADAENNISAETGDIAGNKVVMLYILSVISGGMLLVMSRKKGRSC